MTSPDPLRTHPYTLAFADPAFEAEHFPLIREDADTRSVRTADPGLFLLMAPVGALIRDMLSDAEGTEVEQFGPLLFQAYHFWRYGKHVYQVEAPVIREVIADATAIGHWELVPPAPAGYLQLPRNLVWSRIDEDARPEPVDGLFWTLVGTGDPAVPPYERIDLLAVLGIVPGRTGFSVIPLSAQPGGELNGHWGDLQARADGKDFANILPGGELRQLHALISEPEVLKLISRVFHRIAVGGNALAEPAATESGFNVHVVELPDG